MGSRRFKKLLGEIYQVASAKTRLKLTLLTRSYSQSINGCARERWQPQLFAHRLLGERLKRFLPLFEDLNSGLQRSNLRIGFKPYVSLTFLASFIIAGSTMLLTPAILTMLLRVALSPSLLFGLGGCLLAWASTVILFYAYPFYRADKTKRNLDDNMAFSTSYLAILAGAGVPPHKMFRLLSKIPQKLAIVDESKHIVRDVELFGADIVTAMENASKRTSSERFKELLEGLIATARSGGDMMSYLMHRSQQNMRLRRIASRKFTETLGVLSEFYVTLLVAGPLIFVVMLAVMAMLGDYGLGTFNPTLLLMLLTYVGIPVGSIVFVAVLDALYPR